MERVEGTAALGRALERPVLTIGNFDGLHVGHREMLRIVVERAKAASGEAVVYTFDPHPRKVLHPDRAPALLTTLEQKAELLEALGVDVLITECFDREFARISPDEFVREYVHRRIAPREVYVGYDFHFGRDREGSMRLLTEAGPELGFAVTVIPEVRRGGKDVSSTRIRALLAEGAVEEAAALLDRPFAVRGVVVEGDRRGRSIGFPTANLRPENEVLPKSGVYAGMASFVDGASRDPWPAVTNVGVRPTFDDARGLVAEAHLIDYEGDLYGRRIELDFRYLLRPERKFAGVEALAEQIGRDRDEARRRLRA